MSFFLYHTKGHRGIILFLDYALTCSQIIMLTLSPIQVLFIFTQSRIRKGKHFSSQHFLKNHYMCPLRPETRKGCLFSSLLFDIVQEIIAKTMKQEKKWKVSKREEVKQSILENIVIYVCVYVSVYIRVCIYVYTYTYIYKIFLNLIYIKQQQQN